MATPHVAGLAAYILSLSSTQLTVAQLKTKLQSLATSRAVTLPLSIAISTPNLLAYNGAASSKDVPDAPAPDAAAPQALVPKPFTG